MITGPAASNLTTDDVASSGTILGACGAEITDIVQKTHLAEDPNKIPLLFMADIIHGYKTIYLYLSVWVQHLTKRLRKNVAKWLQKKSQLAEYI